MIKNKEVALTGTNNKRLSQMDLRNNQNTFPLADEQCVTQNTKVTTPSKEDVIHAKEWVDNGSRL